MKMPRFEPITNRNEMNLSTDWVDSATFKSKNRLVLYEGKNYQLIEKKERPFSGCERFGRVLLGVILITSIVGYLIYGKVVMNLLYRKKEVLRFGLLLDPPKNAATDKKIKSLVITGRCKENYPCQHASTITYEDGQVREGDLTGSQARKLMQQLPKESVTNQVDSHFGWDE